MTQRKQSDGEICGVRLALRFASYALRVGQSEAILTVDGGKTAG
jgi:hypothetical protein